MHTDSSCISVILEEGGLCYAMKYRVHNSERVSRLNEYLFCCFIFKERVMSTGEAPRIILTSRVFSH
jgi:hypothetical protein